MKKTENNYKKTAAFARGSPVSSIITFPAIVPVWANAVTGIKAKIKTTNKINDFFILLLLFECN